MNNLATITLQISSDSVLIFNKIPYPPFLESYEFDRHHRHYQTIIIHKKVHNFPQHTVDDKSFVPFGIICLTQQRIGVMTYPFYHVLVFRTNQTLPIFWII